MEPSETVVKRDVPIMLSMEVCVSDMVQKLRGVVMKDVPNMHRRKEYVLDMVQRLRLVAWHHDL